MKMSEELLGQILSRAPSSETTFLLLQELKAQGPVEMLIREATQALGRYPGDIRIRGLLAEACLQSGWLSRAESEVEKAAAQIEDLVSIYKLQAQIYSSLNRTKESLRCLEIYQAHRPDDPEAADLLQRLRPAQEAAASDALLESPEESLKESSFPAIPEIATPTLAEVYFAQGQIQEAISTYEKVLLRSPEAAQSRARLEELKALLAPPAKAEPSRLEIPTLEPVDSDVATKEPLDAGASTVEPNSPGALSADSPFSPEPAEPGKIEVFTPESLEIPAMESADFSTLTVEPEKAAAEHLRKKKEKLLHILESWRESIAQPPASSRG